MYKKILLFTIILLLVICNTLSCKPEQTANVLLKNSSSVSLDYLYIYKQGADIGSNHLYDPLEAGSEIIISGIPKGTYNMETGQFQRDENGKLVVEPDPNIILFYSINSNIYLDEDDTYVWEVKDN